MTWKSSDQKPSLIVTTDLLTSLSMVMTGYSLEVCPEAIVQARTRTSIVGQGRDSCSLEVARNSKILHEDRDLARGQ